MQCRQGPEGGKEAVDRRVATVSLVERPLACSVVYEGHPVLAQGVGEGYDCEDLREDLKHIDVGSPGVEFPHEPVWH